MRADSPPGVKGLAWPRNCSASQGVLPVGGRPSCTCTGCAPPPGREQGLQSTWHLLDTRRVRGTAGPGITHGMFRWDFSKKLASGVNTYHTIPLGQSGNPQECGHGDWQRRGALSTAAPGGDRGRVWRACRWVRAGQDAGAPLGRVSMCPLPGPGCGSEGAAGTRAPTSPPSPPPLSPAQRPEAKSKASLRPCVSRSLQEAQTGAGQSEKGRWISTERPTGWGAPLMPPDSIQNNKGSLFLPKTSGHPARAPGQPVVCRKPQTQPLKYPVCRPRHLHSLLLNKRLCGHVGHEPR